MRLACTAVLFLTSLAPPGEPVLMPGQPLMPMLPAAPLPTIPPEVEIANEPNAFSCQPPAGDEGPPPGFGEGDGLFNLGTQGVQGNDLVTVAAGLKARCSDCLDVGLAWEKSVTGRQDFLDNRLLFECILRY
jgi:hypothetical protein